MNFPLRAGKGTPFEGGVRGIGFVNGGSNIIPKTVRGTVNRQLLHAVDWLPTLVNMAVNDNDNIFPKPKNLPNNLDGFDLWDVLVNNATVPRDGLPININMDVEFPSSGYQVVLIQGKWKFILQKITQEGGFSTMNYDGWFPAPPAQYIPPPVVPPWDSPYKFLFDLDEGLYMTKRAYVLQTLTNKTMCTI